jgi:transposase
MGGRRLPPGQHPTGNRPDRQRSIHRARARQADDPIPAPRQDPRQIGLIDALAVARAALAEPNLPIARHDAVSRELKLLVDRREDLIMQRTAAVNRLRWRVHELDPTRPKSGTLAAAVHRNALREWLAPQSGLVAELARDELADITQFTEAIDELALRIKRRVIQVAPALLALPGVGEITAATIVGETALVGRFSSEAAFARHIGVAPVPHSSGDKAVRFRSTRSGNRQLNKAIHRIAVGVFPLSESNQF